MSRRQALLALGAAAMAGCAPTLAAEPRDARRPATAALRSPAAAPRAAAASDAASIETPSALVEPVATPTETSATLDASASAERITLKLPPRDPGAETGSAFIARTKRLPRRELEEAIFQAIVAGNVPPFLRTLVPVDLSDRDADGGTHSAIIHVSCDYLAVGSDDDFLNIPMTARTAQRLAVKLHCILPTPKLVREIWRHADVKLKPLYIDGGPDPDLDRHDDYAVHKTMLDEQRAALHPRLGALTAGNKKDIVVTNRLVDHPGKVAIYGWQKRSGKPIQPLSTRHSAIYADYSHGVRLVADTVLVDGVEQPIAHVLCDGKLCPLLTDEGPLEVLEYPI